MLRRPPRSATVLSSLAVLAACAGTPSQERAGAETLGASGAGNEVGTGNDIPGAPNDPGASNSPSPGGSVSPGPGGIVPAPGAGPSPDPGGNTPSPGVGDVPVTGGNGPGPEGNLPSPGAGGDGPGPGGTNVPAGGGSTPGPGGTNVPAGGGDGPGNGGSPPGSGGSGSGGVVITGGTGGVEGSGPELDQNGKANAAPGNMTSTPQDYLRLGEIRILNNNWGAEELGCNAPMTVFVNQDSTFGWTFNRGDCDAQGSNQNPDFPQVEFGIHPFGIGDELVTSPEFSSTTLMPIQIKDIQSASVTVQNLNANLQRENSWNLTFEFWISERDPVNDPNPGVYAELMTFWGWQNGRWPAPPNGEGPLGNGAGTQIPSGGKTYTLWVQDDSWANGQWRYFQFRADDGPQQSFNGTLDVKPFLDYLVNSRQYSPEFWVTRLEVGSEIDDETQGTVQMSGITFEVNGQTRSAVVGGN